MAIIKVVEPKGDPKRPPRLSERYMSDEKSEWLRARYIAAGLIKPASYEHALNEHPEMSPECLARYRDRLIKQGILRPRRLH